MEDLRCTETFGEAVSPARNLGGYSTPLVCRAYRDPVILEDTRVFQNMLDIEEFYVAASNYFQNTQTEIKPHMRKIVTDWMLEVRTYYIFLNTFYLKYLPAFVYSLYTTSVFSQELNSFS